MPHISIASLVRATTERLDTLYHNKILSEQYTWWMLEEITKKKKLDLILRETIVLTMTQQECLHEWINKQVNEKMPLQYLIGTVPFNDLTIKVKQPILIPRVETEEWCIALIEQLKKLPNQKLTILDLCTGTGCIGIALAKAFPKAQVYATDISDLALELAHENAHINRVANITFVKSNLFEAISPTFVFDLIVANPPYIAFEEWNTLDDSVKKWEDKNALVAFDDGLALIKQIIEQAPLYLTKESRLVTHLVDQLYIEIGNKQADAVTAFMAHHNFIKVNVYQDLEGKNRVVSGRINHAVSI